MRSEIIVAGLLLFCFLANEGATAGDPEWVWVHGRMSGAAEQALYMKRVHRMFAFYQEQTSLKGRLVAESDLERRPVGRVVFLGPIGAFEHPEWFGLPMKIESAGKVEISGITLDYPRTGIYCRNRENTRLALTGLSLAGFFDIYSVPTGNRACTVTFKMGKIRMEGDFEPRGLTFDRLPLLDRFPSAHDLRNIDLPEGAIEVKPVVSGPGLAALTPEFRNWLRAFVNGQEVLFVGESHWNVGVNGLFNLIVKELLACGRLRSVFLEINYSYSGYYNHYISEPNDEKAELFLKSSLHPLVGRESVVDLLETMRTWNSDHPGQPVRIACLDMEWYPDIMLRRIIVPYLRRVDSRFSLPAAYILKKRGWESQRAQVDRLLVQAREEGIVGDYPFLTPAYMETAAANLWDTLAHDDSIGNRQRTIIRNVTEFSGGLLSDGLVLFKGGGFHAVKRPPEGEAFHREAAYLNEVHPATRGKVKSLMLNGVGFSLKETVGLDLKERMPSATNYNNFVTAFQIGLSDRTAAADGFYMIDQGGLNLFDSLAAKIGYQSNRDIFRIDRVDWDRLVAFHGDAVKQNRVLDYDALIYVLRSKLEVTRPLLPDGK